MENQEKIKMFEAEKLDLENEQKFYEKKVESIKTKIMVVDEVITKLKGEF
jgi:hypothetical protein